MKGAVYTCGFLCRYAFKREFPDRGLRAGEGRGGGEGRPERAGRALWRVGQFCRYADGWPVYFWWEDVIPQDVRAAYPWEIEVPEALCGMNAASVAQEVRTWLRRNAPAGTRTIARWPELGTPSETSTRLLFASQEEAAMFRLSFC